MPFGVPSSPPAPSPSPETLADARSPWRFEGFELDPWAGRLTRDGHRVTIQAQPLKLLTLLVSKQGSLVTREEIREYLWSDTHVDWEQGIHYAIRQVRQALDDSAAAPRFVETVPGDGYRFIAPVVHGEEPGADAKLVTRPRTLPWGMGIAASVLLVALFAQGWMESGPVSSPEVTEDPSAPPAHSRILILPFEDLGAEEQTPFGEILAAELIAGLGHQLQGELDPLAFETVRRLAEPAFAIEDLDPDYVVEGTVQPTDSHLRVTVKLIDRRTLSQVWSTAYEQRSVGELPEVARAMSKAIGLHLGDPGRQRSPHRRARDPEAYGLYRQARRILAEHLFLYNRDSELKIHRAHALLENAIDLDPTVASYHLELARIHAWRWDLRYGRRSEEAETPEPEPSSRVEIPNEGLAREHLRIALALDGQLEDAHLTLGYLAIQRDLDSEAAGAAVERALALNPSLAWGQYLRGLVLALEGRPEEADQALHRALALSPLEFPLHMAVGRVLFVLRRYREAEAVLERTRELLPPPYECLTCVQLLRSMALLNGQPERAVEWSRCELMRLREIGEPVPRLDAATAEENLRRYREWRLTLSDRDGLAVESAALLVEQGDNRAALDELLRGSHDREDWYRILLALDPRFDPLRDDPRFHKILTELFSQKRSTADLDETRGGESRDQRPVVFERSG